MAVIAGAFGAHGLADVVDGDGLQAFRTASSYHLIHSLALCLIGVWLDLLNRSASGAGSGGNSGSRWLPWAGWSMLLGIICFSGSLYLLVLFSGSGPEWLGPVMGPVTPIGGMCFSVGWLALARAATSKGPNAIGSIRIAGGGRPRRKHGPWRRWRLPIAWPRNNWLTRHRHLADVRRCWWRSDLVTAMRY